MLGLLRRFPGYTLATLRAESAELIRLVHIEAMGGGENDG